MDDAGALVFITASYLFGGMPQVYLLGRLKGRDLRQEADLHIALWGVSRPLGVAGILGDLAKGPLVVLIARLLGLGLWAQGVAGLGVVLGQMWPLFLRQTGGKGNSTGLAMSVALAPGPLLLALIPILASLIVRTAARYSKGHSWLSGPPSRSLPIGMLIGFASLPFWSWRLEKGWGVTLPFLALFVAIAVRRLTAGVGADRRSAPTPAHLLLNRFLYDRSFL